MRMNRGTVLLLAISLVVIVAVLALTFSQATAPGQQQEPIAEATEFQPVAVFPGLEAAAVQRLEVRDNLTGERTVLSRFNVDGWEIADPRLPAPAPDVTGDLAATTAEPSVVETTANMEVDQAQVDTLLTSLTGLQAEDAFEADNLAQYGLDTPAYAVFVVGEDNAVHVLYIGDQNPSGTRYYAVAEQIADAGTRPDLGLMQPDLERLDIQTSLTDLGMGNTDAEGLPPNPTLEALATAMREEEDEDARLTLAETYQAIIDATNVAAGTAEATGEAAATAEVAGAPTQAAAATAEATAVAEDVERPEVQTSIETLEATADVQPTQPAAVTAEAEGTLEPVSASITLEGPRTVYLINAQPIRTAIAIIQNQPLIEVAATETPVAPIMQELGTEEPSDFDSIPTAEATAD